MLIPQQSQVGSLSIVIKRKLYSLDRINIILCIFLILVRLTNKEWAENSHPLGEILQRVQSMILYFPSVERQPPELLELNL